MMAKFDGKSIRGSIGKISFSKIGNETIGRSKPGRGGVKQTAATKKTASLFGAAISPFAKIARSSFHGLVNGLYDRGMVNRMNSDISTILYQHVNNEGLFDFNSNSFDRLKGFEFNVDSALRNYLLVLPVLQFGEEKIEVNFKEFMVKQNLKFPSRTTLCHINLQVSLFNFEKNSWNTHQIDTLKIEKQQLNSDATTFCYDLPAGSLCLVAIGLHYFSKVLGQDVLLNHKGFNPAAVVASSFSPGKAKKAAVKDWQELPVKLKVVG